MATFEVFVPVQGEIIYRIEANSATDAENIVSTMDWSDGDLNVDYGDDDTRVELIDGCGSCGRVVDDDADELEFLPVTFHAETDKPYAMRHYRL